jgi:integrase
MKPLQMLQESVFDLCYYGGMQPSEVLEMQVSDIDWMYGQLYERKKSELQLKKKAAEAANGFS